MAPIISGCCCYDSLEAGSRASAWLTVGTGFINLIIGIRCLIQAHWLEGALEPNEKWAYLPPGVLVLLYLELACNVGMILIGLCLMVGMNRGYQGESMIKTWKIGIIFFRSFEVCLGIYLLAWVGAHRVTDIIYMQPEIILVAAYWILTTILIIAAVLCVVSYWYEIQDAVYGKERRVKFYQMKGNLRKAALGVRPGTATPSAYNYSMASMGMSQMGMSQASFAPSHMSAPMSHSSAYPPHQHYPGPQHPQQQHPGGAVGGGYAPAPHQGQGYSQQKQMLQQGPGRQVNLPPKY